MDPMAPKKHPPTSQEVATALEALTLEYGEEMAQSLYAWHEELNRKFFDGQLETPIIWPGGSAGKRDGAYSPRTHHGLKSTIYIYKKALRTTPDFVKEVLLHEMIHQWAEEVVGDSERSYRGHGPIFCKKANEIGKALGYAEVAPKGRQDKAIPGAWPHWDDTPELPADGGDDADEDDEERDEEAPVIDMDDVGGDDVVVEEVKLQPADSKYEKRFSRLRRDVQLAVLKRLTRLVVTT